MLKSRCAALTRLTSRQRPNLVANHSRLCSSASGESCKEGASSASQAPRSDESPRITPSDARSAEPPTAESDVKLTRLQRGALGTAGTALTSAGVGGYAWLHWPLLGPSQFAILAGSCGVALLAIAAKGGLPGSAKKIPTPKQVLELKLLNDAERFRADVGALKKLASDRPWPQEVSAALAKADKVVRETEKATTTQRAKDLLADVKQDIDNGVAGDAIRARLRPRLFVFDFPSTSDGFASARPQGARTQLRLLSDMVAFIIETSTEHDEALLRLTSPGGAVPTYGLAAAQLERLRTSGVRLTVCVDTVAASGGYMMACVANQIVAAPFASVGSIGVLAGMPNFHRVLERNEVEFQQITAGKYKRTVNVLTPNTEEGLAKFREEIDTVHDAFKEHVSKWRPNLDIDEVATGEVWLGSAALRNGLVDSLGTSASEIRCKVKDGFQAVELAKADKQKKGFAKLLEGVGGGGAAAVLETAAMQFASALSATWERIRSEAVQPRVEAPHPRDSRL